MVKVQTTPNPLSLKFIPPIPVYPVGVDPSRTFFIKGDVCLNSPFAKDILAIEGLQGVFLGQNFITITKLPGHNWETLKPIIIEKIKHIADGSKQFLIIMPPEEVKVDKDVLGIEKQIKDIINTRVRPAVAQDGGDIVFHSFENGTVYLKLLGACLGCPSSTMTLKSGIEKLLQYYVPEVKAVQEVRF